MVERDQQALELIHLYGALRFDAFAEGVLKGAHRTVGSRIVSRLCESGQASRREFLAPGGKRWCYFQAAGAKPLGPEALARTLTVANFCIFRGMPKLSTAAMREAYPFMPVKGNDYCVLEDGLCLIKVDRGTGDADRIVRRLRDLHRSLYVHDGYRYLIQTGRFSARVIVPSDSRADQLNRYLSMSPPPYPVIPVVDEDLLELL